MELALMYRLDARRLANFPLTAQTKLHFQLDLCVDLEHIVEVIGR